MFVNWNYFVAAAEELNFTKAAERCFISQQSLSSAVAKMEEALGVELFQRRKKLELTAAGQCLYRHAKIIVAEEALLEKELQDFRAYRSGTLNIGVQTWLGMQELAQVLPQLKERCPDIKIALLEGSMTKLTQALTEGKIDLMFGFWNEENKEIDARIYKTERMILAVPESLWMALPADTREHLQNTEDFDLKALEGCPFIRTSQTSWFDQLIRDYCRQRQIHLNADIHTGSMETLVSLCFAGMGAIICPESYLSLEKFESLRKEPMHRFVLQDDALTMKCAVQTLKNRYLPLVVQELIALARKTLSDFQAQ